ncbi:MAG: PP2C family serine/threonine-protein phosphatase [Cyanobacteria bacterium P01_A01_bin.68]
MAESRKPEWCCIGHSVRGASHIRTQIPNQDAIHWQLPKVGFGSPMILAVADGHGSRSSFRSHIGSRLAVEIVTKIIWSSFVNYQFAVHSFRTFHDWMERRLPQILVQDWRMAVNEHYKANPFSEKEREQFITQYGWQALQTVDTNITFVYGSTILAVFATELFIIYLQLGDGNILYVKDNGDTFQIFSQDERFIANQTTSLCSLNAWREVRTYTQLIESQSLPELLLVSTDGYANSFSSQKEFLKIGKDYLQIIQEEGLDRITKELPKILKNMSYEGSGDDITLGVIKF